MPDNETQLEKERAGKQKTASLLRKRRGKVPHEMTSQNQAYNRIRKKIVEALRQGPQIVPEIAEATDLPGHQVLWHLMAMKKYGKLTEGQERDDYYEYVLSEEQEK